MQISKSDRNFLKLVERLKIYLLSLGIVVFISLFLTPASEINMVTAAIGVALCGTFVLTFRLLSYITLMEMKDAAH